MKTKTETVSVWLSGPRTEHALHPDSLPTHCLNFDRLDSTMDSVGWVKVGTAEVTVTYTDENELREKAAEAILEQMREAAAKYQAMQTELQDRLNKLLAIGYEVTE
jgi:hypothetical protein